MAINEVLKQLGFVIVRIRQYLLGVKDALSNRYIVKGKRTAKKLWEQLKVRMEERCLILLGGGTSMMETVHEAIALNLAATLDVHRCKLERTEGRRGSWHLAA